MGSPESKNHATNIWEITNMVFVLTAIKCTYVQGHSRAIYNIIKKDPKAHWFTGKLVFLWISTSKSCLFWSEDITLSCCFLCVKVCACLFLDMWDVWANEQEKTKTRTRAAEFNVKDDPQASQCIGKFNKHNTHSHTGVHTHTYAIHKENNKKCYNMVQFTDSSCTSKNFHTDRE